MSEVCKDFNMGKSKVVRTSKGTFQIDRERECSRCGTHYKTVEETKEARYIMKQSHEEEIKELEFKIQGLQNIITNAATGVAMLVEAYEEVKGKLEY